MVESSIVESNNLGTFYRKRIYEPYYNPIGALTDSCGNLGVSDSDNADLFNQ